MDVMRGELLVHGLINKLIAGTQPVMALLL